MITKFDIITESSATIGGRGVHPDDRIRLDRRLNNILVSLSESHSFHLLRRTMTIDLSTGSATAGEEGTWLPANLAGVDAVQDMTTGKFLIRRDIDSVANVETYMPRYSVYRPDVASAFWADDLNINRGESQFTSSSLATDGGDYTGEWVRFGNESQCYLLASSTSITETYFGPQQQLENITIRPKTQLKFMAHTDHDTQLRSGSVKVHYWIYHPLMYKDSDILLMPNPRLIDLMMQKEAKGSLSRRSRDPLNAEIEDAWKETLRLNPSFVVPANALDRIGNNFDPSLLQYVRRGNGYSRRYLPVEDWR